MSEAKESDPFAALKQQAATQTEPAPAEKAKRKSGGRPRKAKTNGGGKPSVLMVPVTVLVDLVDLDPEQVVAFAAIANKIQEQPKASRKHIVAALSKLFA